MADKKFSIMQLKPICVEVALRDGDPMELTCACVTKEMMDAILKGGDPERVRASQLYEQLAIFYGGKKEDYFKIDDIRVVKQILAYTLDQIQNPT